MNTLLINPEKFDNEVWQTKTNFNQKQYNEWLNNTAIPTLKEIYDSNEDNTNIYVLGDIINMLSNTEIKIDKYWELKSK